MYEHEVKLIETIFFRHGTRTWHRLHKDGLTNAAWSTTHAETMVSSLSERENTNRRRNCEVEQFDFVQRSGQSFA